MPRKTSALLVTSLVALTLVSAAGSASAQLPPPNWSAEDAAAQLQGDRASLAVRPLLKLAADGDSAELALAIDELIRDTRLSAPERDKSLYLLAVGLADLPSRNIGQDVLDIDRSDRPGCDPASWGAPPAGQRPHRPLIRSWKILR